MNTPLDTAAQKLGQIYNTYGSSVVCNTASTSYVTVDIGVKAVLAFQQAWNAALQSGQTNDQFWLNAVQLPTDGQYGPDTATAFLRYATAARFYPQYIPPTCLNYVTNPPAQPPILHRPPPINPHPIHLQGVGVVYTPAYIKLNPGYQTVIWGGGPVFVYLSPGSRFTTVNPPAQPATSDSPSLQLSDPPIGRWTFNFVDPAGNSHIAILVVSSSYHRPLPSPPTPPHRGYLQGVPAPQSPIALRGYNDGDLGYDGPDGNVYVSEWGRYGNVMAGGRYGGPNGGGFRDDMNPPCANCCDKVVYPPCPVCTKSAGVGAPRFRRFFAFASTTDLQTITNAVTPLNQMLFLLKGQTDPANTNVQQAVLSLTALAPPVAAAAAAVASTFTAPPASVSNAVAQASSAASAITTILSQFTLGTATAASVSQLLSNTMTLGSNAVNILSAYYAQVVINDGCPGVSADITAFQNSMNLAVTDNITSHPTPFPVTGVLDAATIAAINTIYPGQAPNCVAPPHITPLPPYQPPATPPVPPPAAAPQSTTTTVLEVVGVIAAIGAVGGLIYVMNKKKV